MKKITVLVLILSLLLCTVIVVNDYYRSTPVSLKDLEGEDPVQDMVVESEKQPQKSDVSFCITGDNLIHESVYLWAKQQAVGKEEATYSFRSIYHDLSEAFLTADFTIVNQSSLVAAQEDSDFAAGYPLFCSPADLGKDLVELGVDGVNVANNHMLDYGEEGLYRSLNFWHQSGINVFGGFEDAADATSYENRVIERNGIRIAVLSYVEHTNGLSASAETAIPYFVYKQGSVLKKSLEKDVKACKELADFVIVLMNWGSGAGFDPSSKQEEAAQVLCDAGADIIVGSGAKVIQPIVKLSSSDGKHFTTCAYSLGNLMGTMEYMDHLFGGYLTFTLTKVNGFSSLKNVKFHPTVIYYDQNVENIKVLPLEKYSIAMNVCHGSNIKLGMTEMKWFSDTLNLYIPKEYQ